MWKWLFFEMENRKNLFFTTTTTTTYFLFLWNLITTEKICGVPQGSTQSALLLLA